MPNPAYIPLANFTLGSSATSVSFSSIPSSYRDLILTIDGNGINSSGVVHLIYFNSDFTNSNYVSLRMYGSGGSPGSDVTSSPRIGNIYANTRNFVQVQIMDYSTTDKHKTYLARNGMAAEGFVLGEVGRWANTAALTSLRVNPNSGFSYNSGTTFNLYGVIA